MIPIFVFACFLFWEGVGLTILPHTGSVSFYRAVLHAPRPGEINPKAKTEDLEKVIEAHAPTLLERAVVDAGFAESEDEVILDAGVYDGDSHDDKSDASKAASNDALADGFVGSDAEGSADGSSKSSSSSSDSTSSSDGDANYGRALFDRGTLRKVYHIENFRITLNEFDHKTESTRSHLRYEVRCRGHGHLHCIKRRGVSESLCSRHGALEPVAYLWAWLKLAGSHADAASHVAHAKPSVAEVDAAAGSLQARGW